MSDLREVKAIVRTHFVPELIRSLKDAGVTRFFVSRIHALGAGVDSEHYRVSMDEGEAYTEKAKVEFLCEGGQLHHVLELVRRHAGTGHRGDGVVIVSDVLEVLSIRTGDHDAVALI